MQYDEASFFQLIKRKLLGYPLSLDEEKCVKDMLDRYADARKLYCDLQEALSNEDVSEYFRTRDLQAGAAMIIERSKSRTRKIRIRLAYVAAASVLVIVAVAGFFLLRKSPDVAINENAVVFQSHTGEKYELPAMGGRVKTGEAMLLADSASVKIVHTGSSDNAGTNILIVPPGKRYTLILADGTTVRLNAASRVEFPLVFSGTRQIRIEGEAHLNVRASVERPFIVHTPISSIEILGTEFNVNTYEPGISRVALTKGALRVRTAKESLLISPGQEAITYADRRTEVHLFDSAVTLSWLHDEYIFNNERLENIMKIVQRRFGVYVVYQRPELANCVVAGVITKDMTLRQFVDYINSVCTLKASVLKDTVLINEKK